MRICLIVLCVLIFAPSAPKFYPVSAKSIQNDTSSPSSVINLDQSADKTPNLNAEIDSNQNAVDKDAYQVFAVPIIMYHSIHKKNAGKYVIPPSLLEKDLMYLKENGFNPIVIQDLIDLKEKKKPLPQKPIMLTFDDGSLTNYLNAYPLIKKYGFKCVMSVVGAYVDSNYDKDGKPIPSKASSVSYENIIEMQKSGLVEIQSHTYDMHKLSPRRGLAKKAGESDTEYEKNLSQDLARLQLQLNAKAGITPTAVAYPFGSYSKNTAEILEKLGFKAALTCTEGVNYLTEKSDLFLLKRYNRPYGISTEKFFDRFKNTSQCS